MLILAFKYKKIAFKWNKRILPLKSKLKKLLPGLAKVKPGRPCEVSCAPTVMDPPQLALTIDNNQFEGLFTLLLKSLYTFCFQKWTERMSMVDLLVTYMSLKYNCDFPQIDKVGRSRIFCITL